ncbi:MAG: SlyX family protein [Pseudomonadota bacterium]
MREERLIDLETRIAHQDHTLAELNDVVTDQQARIMQLETLVRSLAERLASLAEEGQSSSASAADEKPPHY